MITQSPATKPLREWSQIELKAEAERVTGLPQPDIADPEFILKMAAWEVTVHFLNAASAFPDDLVKAQAQALDWSLNYSASKDALLIPFIERALGRALPADEIEACRAAAT